MISPPQASEKILLSIIISLENTRYLKQNLYVSAESAEVLPASIHLPNPLATGTAGPFFDEDFLCISLSKND